MKKLYFLVSMILLPLLAAGQIVSITDANFKAALVANLNINTNNDSEIQVSEAEVFDGTIDVSGQDIEDMTGLEAFTSLTVLNCSDNSLSTLDVTANKTLATLNCQVNQLNDLNVNSNTSLTVLNCRIN